MTMTDVTVESNVESKDVAELERQLRNAKALVSYHKKKSRGKTRVKGESPRAKRNRLEANKKFNDRKRAMAHVVARITSNDAGYNDAYKQAYKMPVDELRELVKGHEADVERRITVLQERRADRESLAEADQASQKQPPAAPAVASTTPPTLTPKPVLLRPPTRTTQTVTTPSPSLNDVDKAQLEKVRQVVSKRLEIDLTTAQAVSHVLAKYLKNYT